MLPRELAAEARAAPSNWASEEEFTIPPLLVLMRFARWDEILKLPTPQSGLPRFDLFWHFVRGCAFAAKHQSNSGEAEKLAMGKILDQFPSNQSFGMLFPDWGSVRELLVESLDARAAAARGDMTGAINHWRNLVSAQDQMPYHEPPAWYPLRESLGGALVRAGQAAAAEKVFRRDLIRNPSKSPVALRSLDFSRCGKENHRSREISQVIYEGLGGG